MDNFQKNLISFPSQFTTRKLSKMNFKKLARTSPDTIIISGMGGSGLAGTILRAAKKEIGFHLPIIIWRNYGLPKKEELFGAKKPLYIFISFSGNTEETLSGLSLALKMKPRPRIAAITKGGALKKWASTYSLPHVIFDGGTLTPREGVGILFRSLIEILHAAGTIPRNITLRFPSKPASLAPRGRALAKLLVRRIPIIYTNEAFKHLGYIWKIKFNETSKHHAFSQVIPEMDHNELEAFEKTHTKFQPQIASLFIIPTSQNPREKKKFDVTQMLIRRHGGLVVPIALRRRSILEATWESALLADWVTYFMAKAKGIDPAKTTIIDELKELMKK